jgi:hypothetical protein
MEETIFDQLTKKQKSEPPWRKYEVVWRTLATSLSPELDSIFGLVVRLAGSRRATVARYMIHDRLMEIFGHVEPTSGHRILISGAHDLKEMVELLPPDRYLEFRTMVKASIFRPDLIAHVNDMKETHDPTR